MHLCKFSNVEVKEEKGDLKNHQKQQQQQSSKKVRREYFIILKKLCE